LASGDFRKYERLSDSASRVGGPVLSAERRILIARLIAIIADAVQIGFMPVFAGGAASIVNDALDVAVGITLIALLGWNWVFVPALAAELIPMLDLAPTWTIAVLIATRRRGDPAISSTTSSTTLEAQTPQDRRHGS
jgi:hypothetical protein